MDYSVSFTNPFTDKKYQYDFYLFPKEENSTVFSPGLTSIVSFIPAWIDSIKKIFKGLQYQDKEQFIEHLVIAFNLPLGIASALERLVALVIIIAAGVSSVALTTQAFILALVFMVIELALEISRYFRNLLFDKNYHIKTVGFLIKTLDQTADIYQFIKDNYNDLIKCLPKDTLETIQQTANDLVDALPLEENDTTIIDPKILAQLNNLKNILNHSLLDHTFHAIHQHYFTFTKEDVEKITTKIPQKLLSTFNSHTTRLEDSFQIVERSKEPKLNETITEISEAPPFLEELVTTRMQTKLNAFARRVRPWAVHNFYISMLYYPKLDLDDKKHLLSMLDTQLDKTQLIHIIGIIAISLSTISIIFSMIFFPFIIPLSIGVAGILVEFSRYFAPNAFLDQQGWKWSWKACLPFDTSPKRTAIKEDEDDTYDVEMMEIKPEIQDNPDDGFDNCSLDSRTHPETETL